MPRLPLTRFVQGVLIVCAYLLPLAIAPGLIQDASGLPKSVVLALAAALLVGAGLARVLAFRAPLAPATPVALPAAAVAAVAVFSLAGTPAAGEGLAAALFLGAMLTVMALSGSLASREPLLDAIMIAASIAGLYGIAQYLGFDPVEWASHFRPRVFSTLGNPVFFGNYLAAVFPLVFARWLVTEREETKDLLTLLLAVLALGIFLSWTRSSWFGLGVGTAVQIGLLAADARGRALFAANRTWLLSAAVAGLIGFTLVSSASVGGRPPVPVLERLTDAVNPQGYSARFRLLNAEVCARIARDHPLFGTGLGGYCAEYPLRRLKTRAAIGSPGHFFASQEMYAHDDHLQILAELGIVGLGLWIWFLVCALRWAAAVHRSGDWYGLAAVGVIATVAADGLMNFPLRVVPPSWVLFASIGMLAAAGRRPVLSGDREAVGVEGDVPLRRRIMAWGLVAAAGLLSMRPIWNVLYADRMLLEGDRQVGYNNYEMAYAYYGWGLEHSPRNRFLAFRFSVAAFNSGRFDWTGRTVDESMHYVQKALALGYHDENVYKQLSMIFERKTALRRAIPALDTAHALHPLREDITNNLAYYLAECSTRLDEAVELAKLAVKQVPGDPTYLDTLGYVYIRAGRFREAITPLETALKRLPATGDARVLAARKEVLDHLALARKGR
ncbi:MAG: O-antigen ligase family protein [Candidatus Coatesbacteria bacterium]